MQIWKKIGLVYSVENYSDQMYSHAAAPIAVPIGNDKLKVYFTARNKSNRSEIFSIIIDIYHGIKVIEVNSDSILSLGEIGSFDEDGVWIANLLIHNQRQYLYYIGWNRGVNVPFRNSIGLAISDDDGKSFQKVSNGPILDRSIYDPCFVASNDVMFDEDKFKMWYLSCVEWVMVGDKLMHKYHIKYAESLDGIQWNREGKVAIDFQYEEEYAISVPRVLKENGLYKMWYSYRGSPRSQTYRIGYAESSNGINWTRKDELVGLDVSDSGWDSEMICYPYVFDHKGERYMLYNGNGYGKTGFGLAVLER
jgi:hypothetical protein